MGGRGSSSNVNPFSFIFNNQKLYAAVNRAFDRVNLEGEDSDIYNHMYRYKAIRELSDEQQDLVYEYIRERAGF